MAPFSQLGYAAPYKENIQRKAIVPYFMYNGDRGWISKKKTQGVNNERFVATPIRASK